MGQVFILNLGLSSTQNISQLIQLGKLQIPGFGQVMGTQ